MPVLVTARQVLLPLTRTMVTARLERDDFVLDCPLPDGPAPVRFPPSWPGDALAMFPGALLRLGADGDEVPGSFTAVEVATRVAVGQLGVVGPPDAAGAQEIGYGFNPEVWGRGLATEAVLALVAHLREQPGITDVVADTAVTNVASERVLEKAGFVRTGTGHSAEDGDLTTWRAER